MTGASSRGGALAALAAAAALAWPAGVARGADRFTLLEANGRWRLARNGAPVEVRGAVGHGHFGLLRESGGNAVRLWSADRRVLDRARESGLGVLLTLPVPAERDGMDWGDPARAEEAVRRTVGLALSIKDHPALMMFAVGNELDWIPPGRPCDPRVWDAVDRIAAEIKASDPDHPLMTAVGDSEFGTKVREIAARCPHLDLLGINAYGNLKEIARAVREAWPGPYAVTEWGPVGHWQRPATEWGAPLEQTGSEKARSCLENYREVIEADSARCVASFVFLWGSKQEITHTWYGILDAQGLSSPSADAMRLLWTGRWPANRAPAVGPLVWEGRMDSPDIRVEAGSEHAARIAAEDPDGDPVAVSWEVRPEVTPAPYAGIGEKPAEPVPGAVRSARGGRVVFTAPSRPGAYRLFAKAVDGRGHFNCANLPFFVIPPGPNAPLTKGES